MSSHQETLAAYKDLGSIYSYGYGALRECYHSFHTGTRTTGEYMNVVENIISAVEFRTAEVQASHLLGMEQLSRDCGQQPYVPVEQEMEAVYGMPSGADGIARDQ